MSSNLLNNDNKTNYLFKKENFKAQTRLEGQGTVRGPKTYPLEGYLGKSIVLQESIFSEDISKNIHNSVYVNSLYGNISITPSQWGTSITDQTYGSYDLSNNYPSLSYYKFYKRVYLEPVEVGNPCFWWIREDKSLNPSPDNNLLSKMVPGGLSSTNDMFNPIVEFHDGTQWINNEKAASFEPNVSVKNTVNWTMDYSTGILALNVSESHITSTTYNIDATSSSKTHRPRISFIRYEGNLGSGGGSGGGGISDASYNSLVEDISQNTSDISVLDISLNKWLFAIPDAVTRGGSGGLGYSISTESPPVVTLEWINPPQKCAAFDFYNVNTEIFNGNSNLDQIYYATNNGLNGALQDHLIWNTITRSMNKLPFHERIVIQYKMFNSNQQMIQDWTNMNNPTISNSTNNNNNSTTYPIFKDVNKAVIISNPNLNTGTTQEIGTGDNTYRSTNILNSQNLYRFRIALDNRSCDGMSSPHTWTSEPSRDISEILNWTVIPQDPNVYIELGNFGPGQAPTSIGFTPTAPFNHENYPSVSEIGTIEMDHTGVMDLSFNTAFNTSANILGQFGFDLSGSLLNTSVQLGSRNNILQIQGQFDYCNRQSFTFQDVSYNTSFTNSNNHIVNVSSNVSNPNTWNFPTGFNNNNGLETYPEHIYDISGFYFMNNQFKDSGGNLVKVFGDATSVLTPNQTTKFSTNENTSLKIFNDNRFLDKWNGNVDISNNNETANYQIHLHNPPPNYPSGNSNTINDPTKLAKVRDVDGKVRYAILIDAGSTLDISFNIASDYGISAYNSADTFGNGSNFSDKNEINFITCPHGGWGTNPEPIDAGESIYKNTNRYFTYDLSFNVSQNGTTVLPTPKVSSGNLYGWHGNLNSTGVPQEVTYPATFINNSNIQTNCLNLTIVSDDATGPVNNSPTLLQEKYGGYYNIHKIRHNTGIYDIATTTSQGFQVDDISRNNYTPYKLTLSQTETVTTPTGISSLVGSKTLKFNLGHVSTFDILRDTTNAHVNVPIIPTQKLFGIAMPTVDIPININFEIKNIYRWWTWPSPEKLMTFEIFYRHNKNNNGDIIMIDQDPNISNRKIEWNIPLTDVQSHNYQPSINVSSASSDLRTTYKYSRKGKQGTVNQSKDESQFFLKVTSKNNIYRQDIEYINEYFSNLHVIGSQPPVIQAWDWGGRPDHILWWDYTYNGVSFASNGSLPLNFINTSNSSAYKLKDSRGSVLTTSGANWLGGSFTLSSGISTNHEWYNNDYDHTHGTNTFNLENNQLIWSNGSFKSGFASGGTANDDNPYIDYRNYYNNTSVNLDYSGKGSLGENWSYNNFTNYVGDPANISGNYKFIVLEDSTGDWRNTDLNGNQFNGVEVYINGSEVPTPTNNSTSLTLGDDYIMYICGVGNFYQNKSNAKTFTDAGNVTVYRSGWMDCQKQLQSGSFGDGVGCFSSNSIDSTGVIKYGFEINGLSTGFATIDKFFYRIGLKNDGPLSSSTYTTKNIIKNIKINYGRL